MARFTGGWIKLHRRAIEEDIGHNGYLLAIWVTLLVWATRHETTVTWCGRPRKVPPGSVLFGMQKLADHLQFSKKTAYKWLHYLEERQSILLEVETRGSLVTICNWKEYQEIDGGVETPSKRQVNAEETLGKRWATPNGEERSKKEEEEGRSPNLPDVLDELYQLYPRRDGDQRKKQGMVVLAKLVHQGKSEDLRKAIVNYSKHCRDREIIGTSFVAQFKTFVSNTWEEWITPPNGKAHFTEEELKAKPGFTYKGEGVEV